MVLIRNLDNFPPRTADQPEKASLCVICVLEIQVVTRSFFRNDKYHRIYGTEEILCCRKGSHPVKILPLIYLSAILLYNVAGQVFRLLCV